MGGVACDGLVGRHVERMTMGLGRVGSLFYGARKQWVSWSAAVCSDVGEVCEC